MTRDQESKLHELIEELLDAQSAVCKAETRMDINEAKVDRKQARAALEEFVWVLVP